MGARNAGAGVPDKTGRRRGAGDKIGPNAVLIFDIRLEKVMD